MSDTARRFTHDRGGPSTRPPTERGGDGMTHEEMSVRLRVLADCPTLTVENRAELDRIANELAPPRPEPGTVVWYRRTDADPLVLAIVEEGGEGIVFDDRSYLPWFNVYEWKPAYVAPHDTDPGTEALIDELQNRIADLEDALERLTSACERNHKTIYMGTTHDRYDMAYERGGEDPVKLARAALAEGGQS